MKQEDKELLLKDLCGRLSYGLIINVRDTFPCTTLPSFNIRLTSFVSILSVTKPIFNTKDKLIKRILNEHTKYLEFRPFLRPMSSMTEEERKEYNDIVKNTIDFYNCPKSEEICFFITPIDWLNAHHFDYRGLIPKGLAIVVAEKNNPYK